MVKDSLVFDGTLGRLKNKAIIGYMGIFKISALDVRSTFQDDFAGGVGETIDWIYWSLEIFFLKNSNLTVS